MGRGGQGGRQDFQGGDRHGRDVEGQGQALGRGQSQAQPGEIAGALAHADGGNFAKRRPVRGQKRVQGRQQVHQKSARGVDDMFRQHPVIVKEGQAALIAGGIQGQQQQGGYWRVANRRMMS